MIKRIRLWWRRFRYAIYKSNVLSVVRRASPLVSYPVEVFVGLELDTIAVACDYDLNVIHLAILERLEAIGVGWKDTVRMLEMSPEERQAKMAEEVIRRMAARWPDILTDEEINILVHLAAKRWWDTETIEWWAGEAMRRKRGFPPSKPLTTEEMRELINFNPIERQNVKTEDDPDQRPGRFLE